MGNTHQSPANGSGSDHRYVSASRAFSEKELQDLRSLFESLASQSQSNGRYVTASVFKTYFSLDGPLGERLFDLITQQRKDQKLTLEDLIIAKATYEKGTRDEIEEFIYQVVDVSGDQTVSRSDLESVLMVIFNNILWVKDSKAASSAHKDVVSVFVNAASFLRDDDGCTEKSMSFEDFKSWCTLVPAARKFLGSMLMPSERGRTGCQVPQLLYPDNINPDLILLKKEYAWHIGGALSQQDLEEWKLLYHSALHGLSFSTFLSNISNCEGSTILIIKDKEGHIYGGYASQAWERHANFYGDMKSFLLQLYPRASLFRPTGANSNLQWCATNFSSEDIPNGIGFGGRVHHFGLFLSANFDQGHTFSCTTFGSPCLSKNNHIHPDVIECWGVVPGTSESSSDAVKGSVLERFKEDRHMLNMVGLANSSE